MAAAQPLPYRRVSLPTDDSLGRIDLDVLSGSEGRRNRALHINGLESSCTGVTCTRLAAGWQPTLFRLLRRCANHAVPPAARRWSADAVPRPLFGGCECVVLFLDDCVDSLDQAKVFTTLDANSGFCQVQIAKNDVGKTAIITHDGLYEFGRMPFGLTKAPATLQRALDIALAQFKWKTCLIYIDDMVVFSSSVEDHIHHVDGVLKALSVVGITLKLKKCEFFFDSIKYLGHLIKPGKLEIDSVMTKALRESHPPRTL